MRLKSFLHAVEAWFAERGFHVETQPAVASAVEARAPVNDMGARNDAAMAALTGMMTGVKKGSGRKR